MLCSAIVINHNSSLSILHNKIALALPYDMACCMFDVSRLAISAVASPTIKSRYANFKLLSLFISLEIDCFPVNEYEKIG